MLELLLSYNQLAVFWAAMEFVQHNTGLKACLLLKRVNPSVEKKSFQESEIAQHAVSAVVCSVLSEDSLANVFMEALLNYRYII